MQATEEVCRHKTFLERVSVKVQSRASSWRDSSERETSNSDEQEQVISESIDKYKEIFDLR